MLFFEEVNFPQFYSMLILQVFKRTYAGKSKIQPLVGQKEVVLATVAIDRKSKEQLRWIFC